MLMFIVMLFIFIFIIINRNQFLMCEMCRNVLYKDGKTNYVFTKPKNNSTFLKNA